MGLVDHDPSWAARAEQERQRIRDAAGAEVLAAEHVGSTAIPGIPAEPVLDILVGLRRWPGSDGFRSAMASLGYRHHGEFGIVGRHFFTDGEPGGHRSRHVHAVAHGSRSWTDHLLFRDWMRAHPEDADAYARLVEDLAARRHDDVRARTGGRTAFVRDVLRRARSAAGIGSVHEAAAGGFDAAADVYERSRPGYAPAAVAHLAEVLRLRPAARVLDVGAGTGKLAAQLLATGAEVLAVEPVAGMRAVLADRLPEAGTLAATAEDIPLPPRSADAVVAGQAFHWFDPPAALSEFHRLLVAGGGVGLAWNVRDGSVDWVARWTEIADRVSEGAPRERLRAWEPVLDATAMFTDHRVATFPNPHPVDRETLVGRFASTSFVAAAEEDVRAAIIEEFRDLLATHPETRDRDPIAVPYTTEVHTFRRVP